MKQKKWKEIVRANAGARARGTRDAGGARATARVERGWFAGRGRGGDDGDDERTRDGRARDGNGGANARGE